MKKKFDIVAVGGATEDQFFTVDDYLMIDNRVDPLRKKLLAFEYGAKLGIRELTTAWGGGAANVAVAASRLGLKTSLIGSIGPDMRGQAIKHNLKQNGVALEGLHIISKTESGLSYILVSPHHDHIVFTYRGANADIRLSDAHLKILEQARWTYVTSLTGSWQKVLKDVFAHSEKVIWNPGRQQLAAGYKALKQYLARTDILICNRREALKLASSVRNITQIDDMKHVLATLVSFGPKLVIVTNGGHGADASDGKNFYFQKAIKVRRPVDTTGVGDAFGASFVSGLEIYQGDIRKSLTLAAKNAAAVVTVLGAQPALLKAKNKK